MYEQTIGHSITCSGLGLHTGRKVKLSLHPLPPRSGIVWSIQSQSRGGEYVQLSPHNVVDTTLCTCLEHNGVRVGTVEHVMAAIRGLGIDNLLVKVQGPEVPIMDGSAASFVHLFKQAGQRKQSRPKHVYVLKHKVKIEDKGKAITARPGKTMQVHYTIDFPHPMVGRQEASYAPGEQDFIRDVSRARTFGFLKEVEMLQRQGLALGGSLENALVFDQTGVINTEGFRYPDEPVRHKILDFIGDIGLLPYPILGTFDVFCSGHALNTAFARYLADHKDDVLDLVEMRSLPHKPLAHFFAADRDHTVMASA